MSKVKILSVAFGATLALSAFGSAFAAQPNNPGCFGRDRAAWIAANSGAAWGAIASDRAGDNGAINQAYKIWCEAQP